MTIHLNGSSSISLDKGSQVEVDIISSDKFAFVVKDAEITKCEEGLTVDLTTKDVAFTLYEENDDFFVLEARQTNSEAQVAIFLDMQRLGDLKSLIRSHTRDWAALMRSQGCPNVLKERSSLRGDANDVWALNMWWHSDGKLNSGKFAHIAGHTRNHEVTEACR